MSRRSRLDTISPYQEVDPHRGHRIQQLERALYQPSIQTRCSQNTAVRLRFPNSPISRLSTRPPENSNLHYFRCYPLKNESRLPRPEVPLSCSPVPSARRPTLHELLCFRLGRNNPSFPRNLRFPVVLLIAFITTSLGYCVAQMPAPAPLDASTRQAVITKLADELRRQIHLP